MRGKAQIRPLSLYCLRTFTNFFQAVQADEPLLVVELNSKGLVTRESDVQNLQLSSSTHPTRFMELASDAG